MSDSRYDNPNKVYVTVIARFETDGRCIPLSFIWEDGREYEISCVREICRAASLKAGGAGIRYTVRVRGRDTHMFFEEDKWFIERGGPH